MTKELLSQLEQKVAYAIEVIDFQQLQIEELEEENQLLKGNNALLHAEQDKWKHDLGSLIRRFEKIESSTSSTDLKTKIQHKQEEVLPA